MNDRQDLLTKIFRERLANYEQRPGIDAWPKIERQLAAGKQRPTVIVWRWIGVAASILLILAASLIYFSEEKPPENNKTALTENPGLQHPAKEDKPRISQPDTSKSLFIEQPLAIHVSAKRSVKTDISNTDINPLPSEKTGAQEPIFQPSDNQLAEQPVYKKEKEEKEETNEILPKQMQLDEPIVPDNQWVNNRPSTHKGRTMLALSIGNSGANPADLFYRNSSDKPIYNYNAIQYYSYKSADYSDKPEPQLRLVGNSNTNYVLTNVDYNKIPITYSLYFRVHLTSSFAMESGLSYTYLSSREYYLLQNEPSMTKDIKLYYLGIPIKGIWSVYSNNRFSCYLAGGGSIEKCITGKETVSVLETSTTSSLSVPELQFAVAGGIGANYRIVENLGIFIEPGVSYFFDDGSDIRTIRKKTPFNFQIQGGIRMTW